MLPYGNDQPKNQNLKGKIMSENANKNQKNNLKILLPAIVAIIGIGLLLIGNLVGKGNEKNDADTALKDPTSMDADAFAESVEKKITEICRSVSGVGDVHAAVTLGGGYRAIYATDSQSSGTSYRNEMVLTGNGSSEKAILVGYQNPEIVGIGIVCSGGNDPDVRQSIISLVSAAFNVSTNKIYVTGT